MDAAIVQFLNLYIDSVLQYRVSGRLTQVLQYRVGGLSCFLWKRFPAGWPYRTYHFDLPLLLHLELLAGAQAFESLL